MADSVTPEQQAPRYSCVIDGCPGNHISKFQICESSFGVPKTSGRYRNANPLVSFDCFWPLGCSDSKRCNSHGSCVATAQAGGKSFDERSTSVSSNQYLEWREISPGHKTPWALCIIRPDTGMFWAVMHAEQPLEVRGGHETQSVPSRQEQWDSARVAFERWHIGGAVEAERKQGWLSGYACALTDFRRGDHETRAQAPILRLRVIEGRGGIDEPDSVEVVRWYGILPYGEHDLSCNRPEAPDGERGSAAPEQSGASLSTSSLKASADQGRPVRPHRSGGGSPLPQFRDERLHRIDQLMDAQPGTTEGTELDKLVDEQCKAENG